MPATTFTHVPIDRGDEISETFQSLSSVGSSDYAYLQGLVTVQLSGDATSLTAVVERSSQDPAGANVNWAPAEDSPFSGNLANGMSPRQYTEPATGYWRVRIASIAGGSCKVSIIGEKA
jgi:hypothetical protein